MILVMPSGKMLLTRDFIKSCFCAQLRAKTAR
ncbi:unnamed protein product [Chondrus crispus]|uniref:Uncharacterized protein n=1 Tax=Chondrus crispus TaxID=2769 RepID=R7Q6N4_CHOCR|nr:unnamed protein product [Chondrus crispus]CDF33026.1 unnamed protein product [Chondrus crispus]|eukprot:XP_005712829.1 unnamed protein product [Chondrus crispus]